jgi:sugar lactone lactonase YvrE
MSQAEQVTEPEAFHGEGPVWWDGWGGLRYVDMLAGDVHSVDVASGHVTSLHVSDVVAAIRPRVQGGMVAAVERGFALLDDDGSVRELGELWSDASVRMNEGGCDPDGRFYCGSMADDMRTGAGSLYRLDADNSVSVVLEEVTISNGLAWSPDRSRAYYVDSPTQRVDVFAYSAEQGLVERRPFVHIADALGMPDGIAVDAQGSVWVALWGGGAVLRYAADGSLDGRIELPVSQVTACAFGGTELDELYITTSRVSVPEGEQPQAGAVFRSRPGVRGQPALPYAG